MKININLLLILALVTISISCNEVRRKPGSIYMPDMAYSRAYESYAEHTDLNKKVFYNNRPVAGTIFRDEELEFPYKKDAPGDTTNYIAAKQCKNPYDTLTERDYKESERLYLVNCGICHGPKLDGNGPLYKGGDGPYPAKPATLVGDAKYEAMPAGQMFYSVMYGKNLMGSYASQLSRKQRWQVIAYIKKRQADAHPATTAPKEAVAIK